MQHNQTMVKLLLHAMPWEIDHQHIVFHKLRESLYHIDRDIHIHIDACLNLSSAIIDWNKSTLPQDYFIERFEAMEFYFKELCSTNFYIYNGDGIYGHLNVIKESYTPETDYYIGICPDMDFNEYLISHLIEAAKQITNKYFVITPQIYKCWDNSWDVLVNERYLNIPNERCLSVNSCEIVSLKDYVSIEHIHGFKFAGWMDIYNKAFYEKLAPVLPEWNGYGPLDLYAMKVAELAKSMGVDVQQYILKNQIVWSYDAGGLKHETEYGGNGKLKTVYDNFIIKKLDRKEQRAPIDFKMDKYLQQWITYYNKELK